MYIYIYKYYIYCQMDVLYPWWPSSNTSAPIFQAMDPTQSMSNLGSILQLVPLDHYPNACFDHKTLIGKPKAQFLWITDFINVQSAYMSARVGAWPKSCTPSFANFTLDGDAREVRPRRGREARGLQSAWTCQLHALWSFAQTFALFLASLQ